MQAITREVKIYDYVFANIDLTTGTAQNQTTVSSTKKLSRREIARYCEANNSAVLIHKDEHTERFSMPLDLFVSTCRRYADENPGEDAE